MTDIRDLQTRKSNRDGPHIIRLAHPFAFAAFLNQIGAPVDRHFRRSGLPVECDDPNMFVSLRSAWSMFDSAARREDDMLGWHVGQFVGDHNLAAPLLRRIEHAPTLYEGLKDFARFVSSEASELQLGIKERKHDVLLYAHYPDLKGIPGYDVSQSYQLPVYLNVVRHYLGPHWTPEVVGIESGSVAAAAQACFPGSRIVPGQACGFLSIPRKLLFTPPPDLVSAVHSDSPELTAELGYAQRLQLLLRPYLTEGYPTTELAARLMGTSVRSLYRALKEEGLSYHTLVDQVRFAVAKELLAERAMNIRDVGYEVGFQDPAHFSRMFRRISGVTPRQFREHSTTHD